ncbi:MAG TPA: aldolase/citrate lyase family protein [Alphaproteobacteria bacterium]|nr:aldolase/citrate lyase family protein [Alphaproteobacteria bacterium]
MSMPVNAFKRGLARPERMVGVWAMSGSPVAAEALGFAGYDFVVLDMEHGPNDVPRALTLLQAMGGTPASSVVRLPWNDAVLVKQVLDCGAQTLMFPYIQNEEEARRAVAATRYPPEGIRGAAGMSRATRYGAVPDYFRDAAEEICVVPQIETAEAVANLARIAAVPGVDSIFIGPSDLSASLGLIGQADHLEVQRALASAAEACKRAGKPCGILASNAERAASYLEYGYDWVAVGSDLGLMTAAARRDLGALRAKG